MGLRAAPVAVLVVVAFAMVALGQGPEALDERSTTCWPCHVAWPTPLKSFYNVVPPDAQAAPGDVFDYTVQVQNPWLHDILFLSPSLDLSAAPSLKFFDGRQPIETLLDGTITIDPARAQEPQTGYVVFEVPTGATDLSLQLLEVDPFLDQDLEMWIYPGTAEPNGTPAVVVDAAGPGGAESWVADPAAGQGLAQLGAGNWTVQAVAYLAPEGGVPNPLVRNVPFRVQATVEFNANEETTQFLSQAVHIGPGQSDLVTWRLEALGTPGPEEKATLRVDAMVHWNHLPSSAADDYANITKTLELSVVDQGGQVLVTGGDAAVLAVPNPVVGVSMASVSEAVGYASAFLLVASVWTGGMFGRASRRQLNHVFGTAKRRVAFHNFLSYGLTLAAAVHLVLFIIETKYHWTLGLIWGSIAMLAMLALGVTGALQVPMIRRWNYALWRWSHLLLAIGSLVFTLVHLLLDGAHFGDVQQWVGWTDPLDRRGLLNQTA